MLVVPSSAQFELRLHARITFGITKVDPQAAADLGQLGAISKRLIPVAGVQIASDAGQVKLDAL
jgi:hypothetical protein